MKKIKIAAVAAALLASVFTASAQEQAKPAASPEQAAQTFPTEKTELKARTKNHHLAAITVDVGGAVVNKQPNADDGRYHGRLLKYILEEAFQKTAAELDEDVLVSDEGLRQLEQNMKDAVAEYNLVKGSEYDVPPGQSIKIIELAPKSKADPAPTPQA
jgi:hypothetical protein